MDEQLRQKLIDAWDGNAEYVLLGAAHFRVLTPNGADDPIFVPFQEGSYGQPSTGFVQAPEPKSPVKKTAAKKASTQSKSAKAKADIEPIED